MQRNKKLRHNVHNDTQQKFFTLPTHKLFYITIKCFFYKKYIEKDKDINVPWGCSVQRVHLINSRDEKGKNLTLLRQKQSRK